MQIDDHSLYGRFIKRVIIDGKPKSINNVLLDSSLNKISDEYNSGDSASLVQSFIGITIPHFNEKVIIDPDFSVLVDSDSVVDSNSNSICQISKSNLSTSQLAGIIIGSVGFAAVAAISTAYAIYKRKKFILKINRMASINKQ